MLRQTLGALWSKSSARPLGARSGVHPATPTTVVSATSTVWTVTPHCGVLDLEATAVAGPYNYSIDANVTGAVNAADAANPRLDLISVLLSDPDEGDGSATPSVAFTYTAGTPAVTPAVPATPARSLALAKIAVPVSGGGSPTVTLLAPFVAAAGGIAPARSSAEYPSSPHVGQYVDDAALGGLLRWNGTAWALVAAPLPGAHQQLSFVPAGTLTSAASGSATWITLGNITVPVWATQARIHIDLGAFSGSAADATCNVKIVLGAVAGASKRCQKSGSGTRVNWSATDLLTGISTGSLSLTLQATFNAGGTLSVDASSYVDAAIDFLP